MPAAYQRIFLLKTYNYLKDVTNLFLHATALLSKHRAKDRDTLTEQSFIRIYVPANSKLTNKNNKRLNIKW